MSYVIHNRYGSYWLDAADVTLAAGIGGTKDAPLQIGGAS